MRLRVITTSGASLCLNLVNPSAGIRFPNPPWPPSVYLIGTGDHALATITPSLTIGASNLGGKPVYRAYRTPRGWG
jgi:hypothetical protein